MAASVEEASEAGADRPPPSETEKYHAGLGPDFPRRRADRRRARVRRHRRCRRRDREDHLLRRDRAVPDRRRRRRGSRTLTAPVTRIAQSEGAPAQSAIAHSIRTLAW